MFWDRFAEICAEKGYDPASTARRVYVSMENIEAWRRGATPSFDIMNKLAAFLRIKVEDFFGDDGEELEGTGPFWKGFTMACKVKNTDPYKVCEQLALSVDALEIWRKGSAPSAMVLSRISQTLGVPVSKLFYDGDELDKRSVHEGVAKRFELEKLAEQLTLDNVDYLIRFAEFLLDNQLYESPLA